MACSTCGHTMQRIGAVGLSIRTFLCPRCGTVKEESDGNEDAVYVPKLVERCREFAERLDLATVGPGGRLWRTLGVAESINKPEDRP